MQILLFIGSFFEIVSISSPIFILIQVFFSIGQQIFNSESTHKVITNPLEENPALVMQGSNFNLLVDLFVSFSPFDDRAK